MCVRCVRASVCVRACVRQYVYVCVCVCMNSQLSETTVPVSLVLSPARSGDRPVEAGQRAGGGARVSASSC